MWIHNLNPTILHLGPLEIRWYGLVYVLSFFLVILWLNYLKNQKELELSKEKIWDLAFYLMLGVIIGSRVLMIFWEPRYYLFQPLNLFKIWQGGMSFHGGFVGIITACWIYCRVNKLNFWRMADFLSIPTICALALGRIANFINGELIGTIWNGRGCVVFPNYDDYCRHPSTLYAAGYRFIIFGGLLLLNYLGRFQEGFIFWNFVFWEGIGRFIVDFYRQDSLYWYFSLGQWFSLIMILLSIIIFISKYSPDCKKLLNLKVNT